MAHDEACLTSVREDLSGALVEKAATRFDLATRWRSSPRPPWSRPTTAPAPPCPSASRSRTSPSRASWSAARSSPRSACPTRPTSSSTTTRLRPARPPRRLPHLGGPRRRPGAPAVLRPAARPGRLEGLLHVPQPLRRPPPLRRPTRWCGSSRGWSRSWWCCSARCAAGRAEARNVRARRPRRARRSPSSLPRPARRCHHLRHDRRHERRASRTVITFGTFDVFHVGHLRIVERAERRWADRLVVGVSSRRPQPVEEGPGAGVHRGGADVDHRCAQGGRRGRPSTGDVLELKRHCRRASTPPDVLVDEASTGRAASTELGDVCEVVYLPRRPPSRRPRSSRRSGGELRRRRARRTRGASLGRRPTWLPVARAAAHTVTEPTAAPARTSTK